MLPGEFPAAIEEVYRVGYNKGIADVGDDYYNTFWDVCQYLFTKYCIIFLKRSLEYFYFRPG